MPEEREAIPPKDIAAYVYDMANELAELAMAAQLPDVAEALMRARDAAGHACDALLDGAERGARTERSG